MKLSICVAVQLILVSSTNGAFTNTFGAPKASIPAQIKVFQSKHFRSTRLSMSTMDSDFASAMPEKPEMTTKEKYNESATKFIADLENRLDEGVEAVPELEALKQARDNDADEKEMAIKIYELMCEQGMVYDEHPETKLLSPTNFDIKNNLDIPEVQNEFAYLYKYGMSLCLNGILEVDEVKKIVQERLIKRTGLSPEEFDSWLGY
mmetsp:Transcript_6773/g.10303  ORF Transcript_6773/g.10303 Transcript_6773/m.10303 type:complete len:206 (+) Transcript_6773:88-705(+)|eukprot:CAMPEP_0203650368 /NCGR_PEP_ID=MMETSP0088-20131115/24478_1 /ASSEMBLY_ACC=CAM_ASM_001087 /TAXON_ID=426623 /ORGANISM="Chaetoceros affinis, Strain CCMP159" /LENGTH=205 /DNA_ID=CAMNT_0050509119 /DNA_START=1 /DNA_END=618 /DNA_ORIENTATION=+